MNKRKRVLTLTIFRLYFDEIKSGKKKKEYRKLSPYYHSRLKKGRYTHLRLKNGYAASAPSLVVAIKKIVKTKNHYIIHLDN